jgi:hypothetical protein
MVFTVGTEGGAEDYGDGNRDATRLTDSFATLDGASASAIAIASAFTTDSTYQQQQQQSQQEGQKCARPASSSSSSSSSRGSSRGTSRGASRHRGSRPGSRKGGSSSSYEDWTRYVDMCVCVIYICITCYISCYISVTSDWFISSTLRKKAGAFFFFHLIFFCSVLSQPWLGYQDPFFVDHDTSKPHHFHTMIHLTHLT